MRNSSTVFSVGYTTDHLGNVASKTGVSGSYTYGGSRPHAVTAIGSTGYAINPARDLGPRLAHALLPIAGKGSSGWDYAAIPIVGSIVGAVLAGLAVVAVGI